MRREIRRDDSTDAPPGVRERLRVPEVKSPRVRAVEVVIEALANPKGARVWIPNLVGPADVLRHIEAIMQQHRFHRFSTAPFLEQPKSHVHFPAVLLHASAPCIE